MGFTKLCVGVLFSFCIGGACADEVQYTDVACHEEDDTSLLQVSLAKSTDGSRIGLQPDTPKLVPPTLVAPPHTPASMLDDSTSDAKVLASQSDGSARLPTPQEKQQFLDTHNHWRCVHAVPYVKWDDGLAQGASEYVSVQKNMVHAGTPGQVGQFVSSWRNPPPKGPAGENLFVSSGFKATPAQVVTAWYLEKDLCPDKAVGDGCGGSFQAPTGHYTTLIWKSVDRIGCAFGETNPNLVICRYGWEGSSYPNAQGQFNDQVKKITRAEAKCPKGPAANLPPPPSPPPPPPNAQGGCVKQDNCKFTATCGSALPIKFKCEDNGAFWNANADTWGPDYGGFCKKCTLTEIKGALVGR